MTPDFSNIDEYLKEQEVLLAQARKQLKGFGESLPGKDSGAKIVYTKISEYLQIKDEMLAKGYMIDMYSRNARPGMDVWKFDPKNIQETNRFAWVG
jgi:hypothetical protein